MADIVDTETIQIRLREFDKNISQSLAIISSLKKLKEDAGKTVQLLSGQKEMLEEQEQFFESAQTEAERVLTEIETFYESKKQQLEEGFGRYLREAELINYRMDASKDDIQRSLEESDSRFAQMEKEIFDYKDSKDKEIQKLFEQQGKSVQDLIYDALEQIRMGAQQHKKGLEEQVAVTKERIEHEIASFLYKQNALVDNLNQQIDSYQKKMDAMQQKAAEQEMEIETLKQQQQEYMRQTNNLNNKFNEVNKKLSNIEEDAKKSPWKKIMGK